MIVLKLENNPNRDFMKSWMKCLRMEKVFKSNVISYIINIFRFDHNTHTR